MRMCMCVWICVGVCVCVCECVYLCVCLFAFYLFKAVSRKEEGRLNGRLICSSTLLASSIVAIFCSALLQFLTVSESELQ